MVLSATAATNHDGAIGVGERSRVPRQRRCGLKDRRPHDGEKIRVKREFEQSKLKEVCVINILCDNIRQFKVLRVVRYDEPRRASSKLRCSSSSDVDKKNH